MNLHSIWLPTDKRTSPTRPGLCAPVPVYRSRALAGAAPKGASGAAPCGHRACSGLPCLKRRGRRAERVEGGGRCRRGCTSRGSARPESLGNKFNATRPAPALVTLGASGECQNRPRSINKIQAPSISPWLRAGMRQLLKIPRPGVGRVSLGRPTRYAHEQRQAMSAVSLNGWRSSKLRSRDLATTLCIEPSVLVKSPRFGVLWSPMLSVRPGP